MPTAEGPKPDTRGVGAAGARSPATRRFGYFYACACAWGRSMGGPVRSQIGRTSSDP
jgi:hypothetical protein